MKINRSFKTENIPQCPYTLRSHTQPSDGWVVSEVAGQRICRARGRGAHGAEGREVLGADGPGKPWRIGRRTTRRGVQRVDGQETGEATGRGRCWTVSQVTQVQRAAGLVTSMETGQGAQGTIVQATQETIGQGTQQTNDQGLRTINGQRMHTSGRGGHRRSGGGAGRQVSWSEFSVIQFTEDSVKGTSDESDMLTAEKLLTEYTRPVANPPDDNCSICIGSLREPSGLCSEGEDEGQEDGGGEVTGSTQACHPSNILEFTLCHHVFHRACVVQLIKHARHHLQCPYCKTIHGVRVGNQPITGQMRAWSETQGLPGHPNAGTFVIKYSFQDGVQSRQHPNPGHVYRAHDFPRLAYLPTTDKGRKVLYLLREAWRRRLLFTVGTSATSGLSNVITWADIHHKTNRWSNHNGHGYPDPGYLDNVLEELWAAGVTEESMAAGSGGVV